MGLAEFYIQPEEHSGPHLDEALLRGWPLRRVIDRYDPDHIEDAASPHPIRDARESLLASVPDLPAALQRKIPGLTEALGAFHAASIDSEPVGLHPELNPELVLKGARWLRNKADPESAVYTYAASLIEPTDISKSTTFAGEQQAYHQAVAARNRSSGSRSTPEPAEKDSRRKPQRFSFENDADTSGQTPGMTQLRRIFRQIRVTVGPDGSYMVKDKKGYPMEVKNLVKGVVADPNSALDFFEAVYQIQSKRITPQELPRWTDCIQKLGRDYQKNTTQANVTIEPQFVGGWMSLVDELPEGLSFAQLNGQEESEAPSLVAAVSAGVPLIRRGLDQALIRAKHISDLVEPVYILTDQGLAGMDKVKQIFTLSILEDFFDDNVRASNGLVALPVLPISMERRLKALDLVSTLNKLGIHFTPSSMTQKGGDKTRNMLIRESFKEVQREFQNQVGADTAGTHTLFARFFKKGDLDWSLWIS